MKPVIIDKLWHIIAFHFQEHEDFTPKVVKALEHFSFM
jgi:hypothetical protein